MFCFDFSKPATHLATTKSNLLYHIYFHFIIPYIPCLWIERSKCDPDYSAQSSVESYIVGLKYKSHKWDRRDECVSYPSALGLFFRWVQHLSHQKMVLLKVINSLNNLDFIAINYRVGLRDWWDR